MPEPAAERPPRLYISYGVVKSGSTFAFELTKRLFVVNGFAQPRLSDVAVESGHGINFVTRWDGEHLDRLVTEIEALGTPIVVKTHAPPRPAVAQMLESGDAVGHAVIRDPRDTALSLLDAGRSARRKGRQAFSEIVSLDDAIDHVDRHLRNFAQWVDLPGVDPVDYASLTAHTATFADLLRDQTGLTFDHEAESRHVLDHEFVQFNRGVQRRHEAEMSLEDSERIWKRFADVFERYLGAHP